MAQVTKAPTIIGILGCLNRLAFTEPAAVLPRLECCGVQGGGAGMCLVQVGATEAAVYITFVGFATSRGSFLFLFWFYRGADDTD